MKSSAQLYAEQQELLQEKKELTEAKNGLNTNVEAFISQCNSASSSANAIQSYCSNSNDTNLKESASSGGCVAQLADGIKNVISNVESALSAANTAIQAEIDRLGQAAEAKGQEAARAAAREAAARAAADSAKRAANNATTNTTTPKDIVKATTPIVPTKQNIPRNIIK